MEEKKLNKFNLDEMSGKINRSKRQNSCDSGTIERLESTIWWFRIDTGKRMEWC